MATTYPTEPTQQKDPMNPLWALLALPAMVLLLASDAGNNLSIVHLFASGELSLWSWRSLALGAAIAAAPLGYASGSKQWLIAPCFIVCLIGGILTVISTNTDFADQSADAGKYSNDYKALNAERAALIESLTPSDGSLPCKKQKWCDSQKKEDRLAQINTMTNFMDVEVDPLATPAGKILAQGIAYLRAFGVPFVVAALSYVLGLLMHHRRQQQPIPPNGGTKQHRNRDAALREYFAAGPEIQGSDTNTPAPIHNEVTPKKGNNQHTKTVFLNGLKYARLWLEKQPMGRIQKNRLQAASKVKGRETINKIVSQLIEEGALTRMGNGQLAKSGLPDNVVPMKGQRRSH